MGANIAKVEIPKGDEAGRRANARPAVTSNAPVREGGARLGRNRQSRRRRAPAVVKPVRAATNRVDRQCLYAA